MIIGKSNILEWFDSLGVPYWALYARSKVDSGNPIARSSQQENMTSADASAELRKALDLQARGQFMLLASDNPKIATRGGFRVEFEIPSSEGAAVGSVPQAFPATGLPTSIGELDELTTRRANQQLEAFRLQVLNDQLREKNSDLEKKVKDLEKEGSTGAGRLWDAINGIGIDKILAVFTGSRMAAPAVTGVQDVAAPPENDMAYAERLGNVIKIFQDNDPDWLETLELMANKIQKDPSIIKMFKKFL